MDTMIPLQATQRRTVLVVDDVLENRILLQTLLGRAGYRVLLAENGEMALDMIERHLLDLVILDFVMPGMDGAEVARRLRAADRSRELPIIMLTCSRLENHIEAAFAAGANDYLNTPVDRRILEARVDAMLHAADDRCLVRSMVRAIGEHNKMLHDVSEAVRVQKARLPGLPLKRGRWRIAGGLLPCRFIGGDIFDLMPGMRGSLILSLIDVPGHGLAAALVAATVSSQLRALVRTHDLPEALKLLNLQLSWERAAKYSSLGVVELNQNRAIVINAGLPPICLVSQGDCRERIEACGLPPGLVSQAEYEPCELVLQAGERLVLMSNGLTEPFGRSDEVTPCLKELGLLEAMFFGDLPTTDRLTERMKQLLQNAGAQDRDDATLLIAECSGGLQ